MSLGQQEFTYGVNTGVRTSQFKDTDPETLARAGFGQGIVNVAEDLQKFYLDLAEHSLFMDIVCQENIYRRIT